MVTSKLEVLIDLGVTPDQYILDRTLKALRAEDGVNTAVYKDGAIVVETSLPNQVVLDVVATSSGRRAVLQGFGDTESAVAMVSSQECCPGQVMGVIRFQQVGGTLLADGSVDSLPPGEHGLYVADGGDLSQGCKSIGDHYNPGESWHGSHAGDLGNITAGDDGRARFRILKEGLKLSEVIGRAVGITERSDDMGRGDDPTSKLDGNTGDTIACGIIARSAGVFQNPKRICLCDGVVVWDERDRPLAGKGRRKCCGGGDGGSDVGGKGGKTCCKV